MRLPALFACLVVASAAAGCRPRESSEARGGTSEQAGTGATPRAGAAAAPGAPGAPAAGPGAPTPAPETTAGGAAPAAPLVPDPEAAETERALNAAADEAARAPTGADDCETAHNQLTAMIETVRREAGQDLRVPDRVAFLEVCREMPAEARRCLVGTYAMEHQDDCAATLSGLPDDVAQRFQMVVNGGE